MSDGFKKPGEQMISGGSCVRHGDCKSMREALNRYLASRGLLGNNLGQIRKQRLKSGAGHNIQTDTLETFNDE